MFAKSFQKGPCPQVIENAIAAYEYGHRLICSWIDIELATWHAPVRLEVAPVEEQYTLGEVRLALSNALMGFRGYVPQLEPDKKLRPWLIYYYVDEEQKVRGSSVPIVEEWGETMDGMTEDRYWRSEVSRCLGARQAETWTEAQWTERLIEPVLQNFRDRRGWLVQGGLFGKVPVAQFTTQRVRLFSPDRPPLVDGSPKHRLTTPQFNVLQTLIEAGPAGLSMDQLIKKSGHSDAIGILNRIVQRDPDWERVISFAKSPGGGYRIL